MAGPAAAEATAAEGPRAQSATQGCTIVAPAQEAQVPRNALTQRRPDLQNDFYAKVSEPGQPTDSKRRLRKRITKLKELRTADKENIAQLEADVENLVRVVNQLTRRSSLSGPGLCVRS